MGNYVPLPTAPASVQVSWSGLPTGMGIQEFGLFGAPAPQPPYYLNGAPSGLPRTVAATLTLSAGSRWENEVVSTAPLTVHLVAPTPLSGILSVKVSGDPEGNGATRGFGFACAVASGTTYCWGGFELNDFDQPLNCPSDALVRSTTTPAGATGFMNASGLGCLTLSGGDIWCGDSSPFSSSTSGVHGVTATATSGSDTCVVANGGSVHCEGTNGSGELGDPSVALSGTPSSAWVQVVGVSAAVEVAGVDGGFCVRTSGGDVWCWGADSEGQAGIGSLSSAVRTPTQVPGLSGVTSLVDVGALCAVGSGGSLWCWGANGNGEVGDGTTVDRLVATRVSGLSSPSQVWLHDGGGCASTGSALSCWGRNDERQVGDGSTTDALTPTTVTDVHDVTGLSYANGTVCAVTSSGQVWCWGNDASGQLGDGFGASVTTPFLVDAPPA